MTETLRQVLEGVIERLQHQVATFLPPLLAGLIIVLTAYVLALVSRWVILRIFKGLTIDKFLRQSGLAFMIDPSGRLRAARVAAEGAYWLFLLGGGLTALSIFDTDLTTQMVQGLVFLLPKLVLSGAILLAGTWLAQYFGRSALVWAVNEGIPGPRRLATLVRVLLIFVAVVVAADQLNFARSVFLAAFIMICGGLILAVSLAVGIGASQGVGRFLAEKQDRAREERPSSLWSHL
ncbi:MAG: hypothetical protein NZV14_02755 [Bryobacteraceae bacterium]|nr:hypothetical protein [Bryobacteraceae bacterium]MDW8377053.1 hypothetical protein [Bryobacterales bacterium]